MRRRGRCRVCDIRGGNPCSGGVVSEMSMNVWVPNKFAVASTMKVEVIALVQSGTMLLHKAVVVAARGSQVPILQG